MGAKTGGNQKRTRKKRTSLGRRKANIGGRFNRDICKDGRRGRAIADPVTDTFLRHQATNRWADDATMQKSWEMLKSKQSWPKRGDSIKKNRRGIRPMESGFTMLDALIDKGKAVHTLLTAASLKLKKVRRHPGYVLIRTYNLKNRPITII